MEVFFSWSSFILHWRREFIDKIQYEPHESGDVLMLPA